MQKLKTEKEMASEVGVSTRTLRRWRAKRWIPVIKMDRFIRYDAPVVMDAIRKRGRKEK